MQQQQQQQQLRGNGWQSPTPSSARSARSREGCLTCKRRKVKCDEQRPRCSHCERLNMECKWRPVAAGGYLGGGIDNSMQRQMQLPVDWPIPPIIERPPPYGGMETFGLSAMHNGTQERSLSASTSAPSPRLLLASASDNPGVLLQQPPPNAVNQVFDFASFMWDADDVWQDVHQHMGVGVANISGVSGTSLLGGGAGGGRGEGALGPELTETQAMAAFRNDSHVPGGNGGGSGMPHHSKDARMNDATQGQPASSTPSSVDDAGRLAEQADVQNGLAQTPAVENYRLMDYFIHAVTPPILAEVETQKKWLVMRRVLVGRANASSMVRWAILAFSNFMLVQREGEWMASRQNHYENALAEVMATIDMATTAAALLNGHGQDRSRRGDTAGAVPAVEAPLAAGAKNHSTMKAGYAAAAMAPASDSLQGRFLTGSIRARAPAAQPVLSLARSSTHRENLLATLFFLSYVDILEGRIDAAHANLKRAHDILQSSEKDFFSAIEWQFLLWLRLLDARAVSAGGEGLFLSTDDELLLVETPPAGAFEAELGRIQPQGTGGSGGISVFGTAGATGMESMVQGGSVAAEPPYDDIEDVLFQILYQPGIIFFQKVQSFMGRISRIDPWHRSRGTVEDEIDVMNIGAAIAADLRTLYDNRPMLMDYAVAGKLTAAYVSAQLAFAVTRSFRTYLSNYYASKVHLHRVAYKTLPLTQEATEALAQIRHLARLLVEGLDAEESLPANMLWPLLMLGSEEQDPVERAWIRTQILRMEKVAGNSKITAQVLEELQTRQDASHARVDIRSVMHAIFNSCFAIV